MRYALSRKAPPRRTSNSKNVSRQARAGHSTNLWTYPGASLGIRTARRSTGSSPTVKPTAMRQDADDRLTNRGRDCSRPLPRLRVEPSHRRREEYRAGCLRPRARSTLRRCSLSDDMSGKRALPLFSHEIWRGTSKGSGPQRNDAKRRTPLILRESP